MTAKEKRKYKKTIEALLYLAQKDTRAYWLLKMLWRAEQKHLSQYGSMIVGDNYIAMSHGPVPSLAYDIVKDARGTGWYDFGEPNPKTVFDAPDNRTIKARRLPNTNLLSDAEKACLDEAFEELRPLSFTQLKKLSHTKGYEAAGQDDEIPFEDFAKDLHNGEEILDYLASI